MFEVGGPAGDAPHRFEKLLGWRVLANIACSSRLERAGYVDVVVVHAENQDRHLRICDLQARDHFYSAEARQIQIENDQGRSLFSKRIQGVFSVGRFADFGGWFDGEQSPQPGSDDWVIVDDQDLHGSVTASDGDRGLGTGAHGRVAVTWKPFPDRFENVSPARTAELPSPGNLSPIGSKMSAGRRRR